jgi:glycosyltransferase involved in cell wall biosynthesis
LIIHGIEAWTPPRRFLIKQLVRHVDAYIAVSRYSAERFSRWSNAPVEQTFILPNCVDLDRFTPQPRDLSLAARYGLQASKVMLTVGRLASQERYKGCDQVIELMPRLLRRFPTLKYLIVGDGDDRSRLQAKATALGVAGSVVFTGHISEHEKIAHYNLADVFVMPSTGEGFGIVLIEAAACGVPVVGSRGDGSREALLEGRLGRLVDPVDQDELHAALSAALETGHAGTADNVRRRVDCIGTFSVESFRSRVADWCSQQAAQTTT